MNLPDGVEVDPDRHLLTIRGRRLLVPAAYFSAEVLPGTKKDPEVVAFMRSLNYFNEDLLTADPRPSPWSAHFDVMVGENGWWVEMSMYGDDSRINVSWPDRPVDLDVALNAHEVIAFLDEAARRPRPPSQHWNDRGGLNPFYDAVRPDQVNAWIGFDDWPG